MTTTAVGDIVETSTPASTSAREPAETDRVAVVIPIPNDPDWSIFEELSEDVPIIVVDDSDGRLSPAPRGNVAFYDYAAQREVMGSNWDAVPHRSAATRNFGHFLAYQEGYDVIVALDYDCRTPAGWLEQHLANLGPVTDAPALTGRWINSITADGFYARGYPYEYRNPVDSAVVETTASGEVKLNLGVWNNVLDLNGIDKLQAEPPHEPGLWGDGNLIALGNIPVCGMNTAFRAELTPAYFFLPDLWVNGTWQLSRHDDIWGGYVLKRLMDVRGDLFAFGAPVVEHTRQSPLERVVVMEQWMHLMSVPFYELVDAAAGRVRSGSYADMFGAFVDEYHVELDRTGLPSHYEDIFRQLGEWMRRWVRCFA